MCSQCKLQIHTIIQCDNPETRVSTALGFVSSISLTSQFSSLHKFNIWKNHYNFSNSLRFSLPLSIAALNNLQYSWTDAALSSLPGTGYVTKLGLQFVSTTATVGINIFAASLMAVCWLMTLFMVCKAMMRSGSRVTHPNWTVELVSTPPCQKRVWAYSPHSFAVSSISSWKKLYWEIGEIYI